jgi:hypothetical protein
MAPRLQLRADLMTQRFGDRTTFAVEVGPSMSADLRVVDLWAAGIWHTQQVFKGQPLAA